jgi:hypothetical protein
MLRHLETLGDESNWNYTELYFERLLPSFTLNFDLWSLYVDLRQQSQTAAPPVIQRALKNCPQSSKFWINYFDELESLGHFDYDQISATVMH